MLEKAKNDILYDFDMYEERLYIHNSEELYETDNENFKESRLIMKKLAGNRAKILPSFIKECRSINEAVECVIHEGENNNVTNSSLKSYISRTFNEYIDYIEEKQIDVQIFQVEAINVPKREALTYRSILDEIEKCEERISSGDYTGAVTSAKTLVEGVCKEILLNIPQANISNNTKLPALFKEVRNNLSLNPDDPKMNDSLKKVISGLNSLVAGINEIRNNYGDSHTITEHLIKEHHALVVVNSAKTLTNFLFGTYQYQINNGKLKSG